MTKQWPILIMTVVLSLSLAGCGRKTDTGAGRTSPAPTAGGATPGGAPAGTPAGGAATGGNVDAQTVFKANCVSCHGDNLEGKLGPNTNLTKVGARKSKDQIVAQITNGGNGMIAFKGKLKDDEINALADWLSAKK